MRQDSELGTHLPVSLHDERPVLQLIGREVCQNMGKVSCDIRTGGERNLCVAIARNRYFTGRDIKV
jgi:hypothetical protein